MNRLGKTGRRALWAAALISASLLAQPARAEVCDTYPETFSNAEFLALRHQLRNVMPARYTALIDRTAIVNGAADTSPHAGVTSLLPSARTPLGRPPFIQIPPGVRRLACLSVHWTIHIASGQTQHLQEVIAIFLAFQDSCTATHSQAACFMQLLEAERDFPWLGWTTHTLSDAQYQERIDATVFHLVAHELGHIIINTENGDGAGRRRSDNAVLFSGNDELRADYLAQRALILTGQDYRGSTFIMIPLALVQDDPGQALDNDYPQHRCRSTLAMRISHQLAPEIALSYGWAVRLRGQPPDPRTAADGLRATADRVRAEMNIGENFGQTEMASCPRLSLAPIGTLKADYDALLVAIDAAGLYANPSDPAGLALLAQHRPATAEGRAMLGTLLLYRLAPIEMEAAIRNDTALRRRLAPLFDAVRTRFDLDEVSAIARGWMLLFGTMNAYDLAPAGTRIDAIVRTTEAALHEAEIYLPDPETWPLLNWHLAEMAVLQRNCAEASRRFARVAASEVQEATLAAQVGAILRTADSAACARVSEGARNELRTTRGWQ